ncbi:hypothetical protein DFH29DRAFT_992452 [Suillus ampliporus]|nr:hypothetical protein DFH29DRAFT_992452 [Suillus ampliporus]
MSHVQAAPAAHAASNHTQIFHHSKHKTFNMNLILCPHPGCSRTFKNRSGLTQHRHAIHGFSFEMRKEREAPPHELHPANPNEPPTIGARDDMGPWDNGDIEMDYQPVGDETEGGVSSGTYRDYHQQLDGHICNEAGDFIPPEAPPPPYSSRAPDDWTPYRNRLEFETAEFLYSKVQMSAGNIDKLMNLWGRTLEKHDDAPPFTDHRNLYSTIDDTPVGDVLWKSFSMKYNANDDDSSGSAPWMGKTYTAWFRDPHTVIHNMLANPDFKDEMDYIPYREFNGDGDNAKRQWHNMMSGNWAWDQADEIAKDPCSHGATFIPIILGSDKMTVSVATGQNDYYPLYASIGNVHNNVRRAHRNAVAIVGFLAIPKMTKKYAEDPHFRKFKKQLFHSSLSKILSSLKPAMSVPEVVRFRDGHFRRVIYGLGPYIADYPEQSVLACVVYNWCAKCFAFPDDLDGLNGGLRGRETTDTLCEEFDYGMLWEEWGIISDLVPFTNDFPRADISELLSPDLLHQIIKGTFKDHLVTWVEQYLLQEHGKMRAKEILDDIDRRIAAAPSFAGLRRFPEGCGFSQWTGDDSKALMKVYLPAIEGHVPRDVVRCFRAFLEFCYIVCQDIITEDTLEKLLNTLQRFHQYWQIFQDTGVRSNFSLPRQHSLNHYILLIHMFGAPNGLCSSIMESKHIKAVKEPWRWSSKFNTLGQMLLTNQRLDKIAVSQVDFTARKMLNSCAVSHLERSRARNIRALAVEMDIPDLPQLVRLFLYDQLLADDSRNSDDVPLSACPRFEGPIKIFNSAAATFFAPSDPSGIGGMRREHIRAVPSWRRGPPRYNTVFINTGSEDSINRMEVGRVLCFFSFCHSSETFPCTLIHWFKCINNEPDTDTGLWMLSVIHLDTIICASHLLPIFGDGFIGDHVAFHNSLDSFAGFYVNKFVDHNSFEIAS